MTTRDEPWPDGTPSWVDLVVPDRHAAQAFYGPLFGWEFTEGGPETGYYMMCELAGRPAAGIGEMPPTDETPPAGWTTYLATSDVDAAATRITDAGGTVLMGPMGIEEFGRMLVAADPTGAVFGLWQAGRHRGAEVANEPGALTWNECMTRDFEAAKAFYTNVFGYGIQDMSGVDVTYNVLEVAGNAVGGLGELGTSAPAAVPPHWLTYFAVDDTDATVTRATELGGQLVRPAQDTPFGRMAVLAGPAGEWFAVMSQAADQPPQP